MSGKLTATGALAPHNMRQLRAQHLAATVIGDISRLLAEDREMDRIAHETRLLRRIEDVLVNVFMADGVEVMTDYARQEVGLPPRGPAGWTVEELHTLERRRLEAIAQPLAPMFIEASAKKGE